MNEVNRAVSDEVSLGPTTVLRDCESEETARVWCERWAEIVLREEVAK